MNVCINYERFIAIKSKFLNVLVLIRQINQNRVKFVTIGIFWKKSLCFNHSNGFHVALMMSMNLDHITILSINGLNYRCIINRISKSEAANSLQRADLNAKTGTL